MLGAVHVVAVLLGIAGAVLVALRRPLAGQVVWLPANALWIVYASAQGDWWTTSLFVVYQVVTVAGVWNGLRRREPDA